MQRTPIAIQGSNIPTRTYSQRDEEGTAAARAGRRAKREGAEGDCRWKIIAVRNRFTREILLKNRARHLQRMRREGAARQQRPRKLFWKVLKNFKLTVSTTYFWYYRYMD